MRIRMTLVCAVVALLGLTPVASAARRPFTKPVKLTGPVGGEPSIATDPLGDVFVAGPQGIPSGVGGTAGIGFWSSRNGGSSFGRGRYIGSTVRWGMEPHGLIWPTRSVRRIPCSRSGNSLATAIS